MKYFLTLPQDKEKLKLLKAGDEVFLSATLYSMRDKAHALLLAEKKIPINLKDAIIYYMGPTPARPGRVCGACGPTTSARMDKYTPTIIKKTSIIGIIGKGERNIEASAAMKGRCIYFCAYGGLGALYAKCIVKSKAVLYEYLGAEAIFELKAENFPLIVGQDIKGNTIYGGK